MEKEKAKKKEEEKEVQIERVYVEVPKKENKAVNKMALTYKESFIFST